jgi:hypothetical protein
LSVISGFVISRVYCTFKKQRSSSSSLCLHGHFTMSFDRIYVFSAGEAKSLYILPLSDILVLLSDYF